MHIDSLKPGIQNKLDEFFQLVRILYNNETNREYVKLVTGRIESEVSANTEFFEEVKAEFRNKQLNTLLNDITSSDDNIFDFIKMEYRSPFGIFAVILDEDIPDIAFSNIMFKIQFSVRDFFDVHIPVDIQDGMAFFLKHFVTNQTFIKETKLNPSQAIIDPMYGMHRFNIIHESINTYNGPIVTVRKHIQGSADEENNKLDKNQYEKSLGVPIEHISLIKSMKDSSFCIFGAPGSGKTTLLRHVIMHDIVNKRNVCVIEDTPELKIPTNISLVTNKDYTIKKLFTATLRQNPSHTVIGETRTDEIIDIMEAGLTFATLTTIHATSLQKAFERIYLMSRGRGFNKVDVNDLISASIEVFVHMDERQIKGVWIRNDKNDVPMMEKYDEISKYIENNPGVLDGLVSDQQTMQLKKPGKLKLNMIGAGK